MPENDYFASPRHASSLGNTTSGAEMSDHVPVYTPSQNVMMGESAPQVERYLGSSDLASSRSKRLEQASSPLLSSTFSEVSISDKHSDTVARHDSRLSRSESCNGGSLDDTPVRQIKPRDLQSLLDHSHTRSIVILDFRTAAQHQASRVPNAINISIPTTLLKRNSYTISKIIDSLLNEEAQDTIRAWEACDNLVLYDQDSFNVGPGTSIYQVALKFSNRAGTPRVHVVKGGFTAILRDASSLADTNAIKTNQTNNSSPVHKTSSDANLSALGSLECALPTDSAGINPFFNNIRQNQDLIGGVGEPIPLRIPSLPEEISSRLPLWLRSLLSSPDSAKLVADKFLQIEMEEQNRMQRVLAAGQRAPNSIGEERYSIAAGVERGDKNRYNNIWPYENSRVRLQDLSSSDSDYVNASHLHFDGSEKNYIATQGPLPTTTRDFWQVVWENDVHTIVMLTKTTEGGQAKCHTYWADHTRMEPYHLNFTEEVKIQGHYSATDSTPFTIRRFTLKDTRLLQDSAREITQIQFVDWPDLHVIDPEAILALIREVHVAEAAIEIPAYKRRKSIGSMTPSRQKRPILSHCSAGCGRTGTFCTIDTVIDVVRKQLEGDPQKLDSYTRDPIEEVVRSFREQRLSIVQTLRQYVLCYDAVLLYTADHFKRTMKTCDNQAS